MEEKELPDHMIYCRKFQYKVKIEKPPIGTKGFNVLERNEWTTSIDKPFVVTGTQGEKWPISYEDLEAYEIDERDIPKDGTSVETLTKSSKEQPIKVCKIIPKNVKNFTVVPSWAYGEYGLDEKQILHANDPKSKVKHGEGDWCVAKDADMIDLKELGSEAEKFLDKDGKLLQYMQLPKELRDTKEAALIYDPCIINGKVMLSTYNLGCKRSYLEYDEPEDIDMDIDDESEGSESKEHESLLQKAANAGKNAVDYVVGEAKYEFALRTGKIVKPLYRYSRYERKNIPIWTYIKAYKLELEELEREENEVKEAIEIGEREEKTFMDKVKNYFGTHQKSMRILGTVLMTAASIGLNYNAIIDEWNNARGNYLPNGSVQEKAPVKAENSIPENVTQMEQPVIEIAEDGNYKVYDKAEAELEENMPPITEDDVKDAINEVLTERARLKEQREAQERAIEEESRFTEEKVEPTEYQEVDGLEIGE